MDPSREIARRGLTLLEAMQAYGVPVPYEVVAAANTRTPDQIAEMKIAFRRSDLVRDARSESELLDRRAEVLRECAGRLSRRMSGGGAAGAGR